jgi:hypothetical protein
VGVCKIIGLFVYGIGLVEPSEVKMSDYYFVNLDNNNNFFIFIFIFFCFNFSIHQLMLLFGLAIFILPVGCPYSLSLTVIFKLG